MIEKTSLNEIIYGQKYQSMVYFNDPKLYGFLDFCRHITELSTIREIGSLAAFYIKTFVDVPFCQIYHSQYEKFQLVDGYPTAAKGTKEFASIISTFEKTEEFKIAVLRHLPFVMDIASFDPVTLPIKKHFQSFDKVVIIPLSSNEKLLGLIVFGENPHPVSSHGLDQRMGFALLAAVQISNALNNVLLRRQLDSDQLQTVLALAKTVEMRDKYLAGHCEKIANLSEQVAKRLGCTKKEIRTIRWSALLHDIGKIGIPDHILQKPGSLTKKEWDEIRRHSEIGAEIVIKASNLKEVAALIKDHHERYDGSGYPEGKKGNEISVGARILAVADAFSAITDGRVYHSSKSKKEAIKEIQSCAGKDFDPEIVAEFIRIIDKE